jgi:hypothetical protein
MHDSAALGDRCAKVLFANSLREERESIEDVAFAARVCADEKVEPTNLELDIVETPVICRAQICEFHGGMASFFRPLYHAPADG